MRLVYQTKAEGVRIDAQVVFWVDVWNCPLVVTVLSKQVLPSSLV